MNLINSPPFNNRSFCNCLLFLSTFFPTDILGNGQRKDYRVHHSLECSECCLLEHDSGGIRSLILTEVDAFLRWLNENKKLWRHLIYKKAKAGQCWVQLSPGGGTLSISVGNSFRNEKQCGPLKDLWKHLSSFCVYYLTCHFCFSLIAVFPFEFVVFCNLVRDPAH